MSREQLSVIDPALIDLDKKESTGAGPHQPMSLRVHMSSPFVSPPYSSHARLVDVREFDNRRPLHSPPPITTLDSPSPSVVDRSSTNTPHQRRSPPMAQQYYPNQQHDAQLIASSAPRQATHFSSRGESINQHQQQQQYPVYPFDHRYDHHQHPHDRYHVPQGVPTHFVPQMHEPYGRQQYPVQGGQPPPVTIVHTDDAATKLTDGIRRRCFNCCTTDTSTWRRSNLSPGKVLCNKCGLFERTHSRPRPDQFPHKRGPLATSTLRGRTPPGLAALSSHSSSGSSAHAHNGNGTQLPPIVGGYQYHHANLTPLNTPGAEYPQPGAPQAPLPGLQSWHNTSGSSSTSVGTNNGSGGNNNGGASNNGNSNNNSGDGPGSNAGSASTSAHGTPLLPSRRPTMDNQGHPSPRIAQAASGGPTASGPTGSANNNGARGGRYDEGLSSNAATKEEGGASPLARKGDATPERD